MTKAHVEVITSVQRRRHWSRAEKERIVAAAMEPDALLPRARGRLGSIPANCFAGVGSSAIGTDSGGIQCCDGGTTTGSVTALLVNIAGADWSGSA
jgi:hypothetical protein